MKNEKFLELVGEFVGTLDFEDKVELHDSTSDGLQVTISLDKESDKTYFEQFNEYVQQFSVIEHVNSQRQNDPEYAAEYSRVETLEDFRLFEAHLEEILQTLNKANKEQEPNELGNVIFESEKIYLTEQAYIAGTGPFNKPIYEARGIDHFGNKVLVKWIVKDCWLKEKEHEIGYDIIPELEEESDACDWDEPIEVEIIELAELKEAGNNVYYKHRDTGFVQSLNEWMLDCHDSAMKDWSENNVDRSEYNFNVLKYISELWNDSASFFADLILCDEAGSPIKEY